MRLKKDLQRLLVEPGGLYPRFGDLLFRMERQGVFVSVDELRRVESEANHDVVKQVAELDRIAGEPGRNWNYHGDLAWLLYYRLDFPQMPEEAKSPKHLGKENPTNSEALEWLWRHYPENRPEIEAIRAYKRAWRNRGYARDWLMRSYPSEYPGINRLHATVGTLNDSAKQDKTGTETGRLSISNPPLQQVPRDKKKDPYRLRRAFVAPPGMRLGVVDQEQLEVRIQAHLHMALFGDPTLRDMALAGDFHGKIAHEVFSQLWPRAADHVGGWAAVKPDDIKDHPDPFIRWCRDQVKTTFYGLAYRKGIKAFGATLWTMEGDPIGEAAAGHIVNGIFKQIPAIEKLHKWAEEVVMEHGGMWGILGGWRPLDKNRRGIRQGSNHPMQEGGSKVAMIWMLLCAAAGVDPSLQVHDELHAVLDEDTADDDVNIMATTAAEAGEILGLQCPLKGAGKHGACWEDTK